MRTLAELVPLRTGECRAAADAVSAVAAGEPGGSPAARAHVLHCLRCQAEVVAFRRVLRVMATMGDEPVATSVTTPFAASAALAEFSAVGPPPWAVRAACFGGLTAAGAAGVLVWLTRRRPLLPAG